MSLESNTVFTNNLSCGLYIIMSVIFLWNVKMDTKQMIIVITLLDDVFFLMDQDLHQQCNMEQNNQVIVVYNTLQEHSMLPKKLTCETWLINYSNLQFFRLFRMEKGTFNELVNAIGKTDVNKVLSKPYTGGHFPIPIDLQILVFMWYMASQDSLINMGSRFKVSPSTVMNIINRILYFILKMKKTYIHFPETGDELLEVSRGFENYPGVVGALDGTHVFITVEKDQQDSYIDRYRRHSINIMGICESNKLFTYVFVGFPGSAHDSRVFENSQLYREIEQYGPNSRFVDTNKYHLMADSAFGVKTWLMTPYKDNLNLTRKQKHHNYCLSSARVVIEHAFGCVKRRWRRTQFINTYNICKTIEIATAACVLHNFCILNADIWNGEYFYDERIQIAPIAANQREGKIKRDRIANNLYNNQHL